MIVAAYLVVSVFYLAMAIVLVKLVARDLGRDVDRNINSLDRRMDIRIDGLAHRIDMLTDRIVEQRRDEEGAK